MLDVDEDDSVMALSVLDVDEDDSVMALSLSRWRDSPASETMTKIFATVSRVRSYLLFGGEGSPPPPSLLGEGFGGKNGRSSCSETIALL